MAVHPTGEWPRSVTGVVENGGRTSNTFRGDTVSFSLSPNQTVAVQQAIHDLETARGYTQDQVLTTIFPFPTPGIENVTNIDGGTPINWAPANVSEIILDSVNGSAATSINVAYSGLGLIVGNEGNDTITDNAANQTIIAGDGNNVIYLNSANHGGGVDSILAGNGANSITVIGNATVTAGGGNDTVTVQNDPSSASPLTR